MPLKLMNITIYSIWGKVLNNTSCYAFLFTVIYESLRAGQDKDLWGSVRVEEWLIMVDFDTILPSLSFQ
jgi:hypothetical protein